MPPFHLTIKVYHLFKTMYIVDIDKKLRTYLYKTSIDK